MTDDASGRIARCSCGRLTVRCLGDPSRISLCHCHACQRRTGSAFGIAIFFARARVAVDGVYSTFTREAESGFLVRSHFCGECGSTVWWEPARMPDWIGIAYGAFAGAELPPPDQQVHVKQRLDWIRLDIPEK